MNQKEVTQILTAAVVAIQDNNPLPMREAYRRLKLTWGWKKRDLEMELMLHHNIDRPQIREWLKDFK